MTLLFILFFSYASHYHPGTMEATSRYRHMPVVPCMVAAMPSIPLGSWLTVRSLRTGYVAQCRVTDHVAARDVAAHRRAGIALEFGWSITPAMCGIHHYAAEPPRACPVIVSQSTARAVMRRMAWRTR